MVLILWMGNIVFFSFSLDEFSDNLGKFFDLLGSGSADEIPDEDDIDDESADLAAKT